MFYFKGKKAQVILETAIVLVCLVIVAIASTRLFAGLNLNSLRRLDLYRDTRLDAVNRPVALASQSVPTWPGITVPLSNPTVFLDYYPETSVTITPIDPRKNLNKLFLEDERLDKAAMEVARMGYIVSTVAPYKANQIKTMVLNPLWMIPIIGTPLQGTICYFCFDLINHSIQAGVCLNKAKNYFQDVLDHPLRYTNNSPFDPNPETHPEDYDLDPSEPGYPDMIALMKEQHQANRDSISQNVQNLHDTSDALLMWQGMIFVEFGWFPPGIPNLTGGVLFDVITFNWPLANATIHLVFRNTFPDINPKILNNGIRDRVKELWRLVNTDPLPLNTAQQAKTKAEQLAHLLPVPTGEEAKNNPDLLRTTPPANTVASDLLEELTSCIKNWEREPARNHYINSSKVATWTLMEVVEINDWPRW